MKHQTFGALWMTVAAVLAACTPGEEASARDSATATPNLVSLTATEYAFRAPDTVAAGWISFRLHSRGAGVHYGHIVQLDSGRTVPQMVDAYADAIRTSGPRPKWVRRFGGPGGTAPGDSSTVTQYFEPGSYVWICPVEDSTGHPHFAKGEFKPFVVHSAGADVANRATAPAADVVVRLLDYSFRMDPPLRTGRYLIRVVNEGVEPHDLVLMKLAPGMTVEDVRVGMNPERPRRGEAAPPPPVESLGMGAGGIASIASGMQAFFEASLTPGEYVMVCMTTAPDGRSHIEHGMIRQITIP